MYFIKYNILYNRLNYVQYLHELNSKKGMYIYIRGRKQVRFSLLDFIFAYFRQYFGSESLFPSKQHTTETGVWTKNYGVTTSIPLTDTLMSNNSEFWR